MRMTVAPSATSASGTRIHYRSARARLTFTHLAELPPPVVTTSLYWFLL